MNSSSSIPPPLSAVLSLPINSRSPIIILIQNVAPIRSVKPHHQPKRTVSLLKLLVADHTARFIELALWGVVESHFTSGSLLYVSSISVCEWQNQKTLRNNKKSQFLILSSKEQIRSLALYQSAPTLSSSATCFSTFSNGFYTLPLINRAWRIAQSAAASKGELSALVAYQPKPEDIADEGDVDFSRPIGRSVSPLKQEILFGTITAIQFPSCPQLSTLSDEISSQLQRSNQPSPLECLPSLFYRGCSICAVELQSDFNGIYASVCSKCSFQLPLTNSERFHRSSYYYYPFSIQIKPLNNSDNDNKMEDESRCNNHKFWVRVLHGTALLLFANLNPTEILADNKNSSKREGPCSDYLHPSCFWLSLLESLTQFAQFKFILDLSILQDLNGFIISRSFTLLDFEFL